MKNRRGFTLIELISVIVILAIIALIAVPIILNIIDKANKSAFKDTAYGVISAGELYFAERQLEPSGMLEEEVSFSLPEEANVENGIPIKGSVSDGILKVNKYGKVSIALENGRYCITKGYNDTDVTITEDVENCIIPVKITNVSLTDTAISLKPGDTKQIGVTIEPMAATNKVLKWESNRPDIAKVSNGVITGVAVGNATITVTTTDESNISKSIEVNVEPILATDISLSETSITLEQGSTQTIVATIEPNTATNKVLKWESNKPEVATVTDGIVTGVAIGNATITVSTTDGSNISKNIDITVKERVYVNGVMKSTNSCIQSGSTCSADDIRSDNGVLVNVQVNDTQNYDFYVVSDTKTEITLIMERNLGGLTTWYVEDDNSKGPITVLTYLNKQTSEWKNIDAVASYSYDNNVNGTTHEYGYRGLSIKNGVAKVTSKDGASVTVEGTSRARLLTVEEAMNNLGTFVENNGEKDIWDYPIWLYDKLDGIPDTIFPGGYWLLTSSFTTADGAQFVGHTGQTHISSKGDSVSGLRPVIQLKK